MSRDKIERIMESKRLTRVNLKSQVPVAILYWTADPICGDQIRFYEDVYKRDERILAALNGRFQFPSATQPQ